MPELIAAELRLDTNQPITSLRNLERLQARTMSAMHTQTRKLDRAFKSLTTVIEGQNKAIRDTARATQSTASAVRQQTTAMRRGFTQTASAIDGMRRAQNSATQSAVRNANRQARLQEATIVAIDRQTRAINRQSTAWQRQGTTSRRVLTQQKRDADRLSGSVNNLVGKVSALYAAWHSVQRAGGIFHECCNTVGSVGGGDSAAECGAGRPVGID